MNSVSLGLLAGAFTTFASLPQIMYVVRTRSMKDISLTTLCMFATGVMLWIVYGTIIHSTPVVLWNVSSFCLYLTQIALKLTFSAQGSTLFDRLRDMPARMLRTNA